MNKIIHLSLARKSVPVLMDVVQGTTAPAIEFVLDDYTPPSNARARIYIKKEGGEVYNNCTLSGNVVTYTPTAGSFDVPGQCVAQLELVQSSTVAVSWRIFVTVEPNLISGSSAPASTEFGALTSLIQSAQAYDGIIGANNITGYNNRQGWIALTTGQDLNSVVTPGVYYANTGTIARSLLNCPATTYFRMNVRSLANASGYLIQEIEEKENNVDHTWTRYKLGNNAQWTEWELQPQRAEVNTIANRGGKNLLPNTATTQTVNGITFTRNNDGSITANGTAAANTNLYMFNGTLANSPFYAGQMMLLSGCTGGATDTYRLRLVTGGTIRANCFDGSVTATIPASTTDTTTVQIGIQVISGTTLNNVTFYPMLRDASIQDDTYVPYGMSNAELTAKRGTLIAESGVNLSSSRVWQQGNTVFVQAYFVLTDIPTVTTTIATIEGVAMPQIQVRDAVPMQSNLYSEPKEWGYATITTAGALQFRGAELTQKSGFINMFYFV